MTSPHLLIVEDDPATLTALDELFTSQGYTVTTALSAQDAAQACQQTTFQLVLTDIKLGELTGFDLAYTLRRNTSDDFLPIIFITGQQDKELLLEALQLGAADFVLKPYNPPELLLRVRNALARADRQRHANPQTGLPDVVASRAQLLQAPPETQALLLWLEGLETYASHHGSLARARLLLRCSQILARTLDEIGTPDDFLGHYDATTFLVLCPAENAGLIAAHAADQIAELDLNTPELTLTLAHRLL